MDLLPLLLVEAGSSASNHASLPKAAGICYCFSRWQCNKGMSHMFKYEFDANPRLFWEATAMRSLNADCHAEV